MVYRLLVTSGDIINGPFAIDKEIPHTAGQPTFQFQTSADLALADDGYQWRVVARDKAVPPNTASSLTRTFIVDTLEPGKPTLVAPADNVVINDTTPFFDWAGSAGDVFDYVLLVTSGDTVSLRVTVNHPTTQFQTPVGLALADGEYRWRVIARDRALNVKHLG